MRRFALTNLKDFGMGKKACEEKICEESDHLVQAIKKLKGESRALSAPSFLDRKWTAGVSCCGVCRRSLRGDPAGLLRHLQHHLLHGVRSQV